MKFFATTAAIALITTLSGCSPNVLEKKQEILDHSVFTNWLSDNGTGKYSQGQRWGKVIKLSKQSLTGYHEGEMLVGKNSTSLIEHGTDSDGNSTEVLINPWKFTVSDPSIVSRIKTAMNSQSGYVTLTYNQTMVPGLGMSTPYNITGAFIFSTPNNANCSIELKDEILNKSSGFREGRIYKMSLKGTFSNTKTYELKVQQGGNGNTFHDMSLKTNDEKIASCIQQYVSSGQMVNIRYSDSYLFNPLAQSTSYQILSVQSLSSESKNIPDALK